MKCTACLSTTCIILQFVLKGLNFNQFSLSLTINCRQRSSFKRITRQGSIPYRLRPRSGTLPLLQYKLGLKWDIMVVGHHTNLPVAEPITFELIFGYAKKSVIDGYKFDIVK